MAQAILDYRTLEPPRPRMDLTWSRSAVGWAAVLVPTFAMVGVVVLWTTFGKQSIYPWWLSGAAAIGVVCWFPLGLLGPLAHGLDAPAMYVLPLLAVGQCLILGPLWANSVVRRRAKRIFDPKRDGWVRNPAYVLLLLAGMLPVVVVARPATDFLIDTPAIDPASAAVARVSAAYLSPGGSVGALAGLAIGSRHRAFATAGATVQAGWMGVEICRRLYRRQRQWQLRGRPGGA